VKIGLTAYDMHATDFVDLARAADGAGFSSLWLGEHVVLPVGYATEHPSAVAPETQHRTRPIVDPDTELVDPLVQLGAAAVVTSAIKLATGIFILPLRHPLAVARSVCTVQDLARGRFVFGVGFGWLEEEFESLDVPYAERVTRFEESIDVLGLAWAGGEINHDGRHFSIHGVQVTPRTTDVALMLGGNGPRALERAARLGDGWFSSATPTFDDALRMRAILEKLRADGPRAADPFRLVFRVANATPESVARYADEGFDEVLIWTDQVWPHDRTLDERRATLFRVAETLGLEVRL
jgi:probable F420-dependent oxidoreductase